MRGFDFTVFKDGVPVTHKITPELVGSAINMLENIEEMIDGRLPHKHVAIPYLVANAVQPKTFLEIGTYNGGSMMLFVTLPTEIRFASIDLFEPNAHYKLSQEQSFRNIEQTNSMNHEVILIKGASAAEETRKEVFSTFQKGIDFLFIDGDHQTESVIADFDSYWSLLNNEAIIVFDDYYKNSHDGAVIDAVHHIIGQYRNRLHVVGNIGFHHPVLDGKDNFEFVLQKIES